MGLENMLVIHNPHNMYVLILVQFGFLGLLALLYMFYTQIKIATKSLKILQTLPVNNTTQTINVYNMSVTIDYDSIISHFNELVKTINS